MQKGSALWIGGLALFALSDPAVAHPHIFIDTGLEVIFDAARLVTGIRVTWAYDEFYYYALMIMEVRGLDPDGAGQLTEAEREGFAGFDMDWDADCPGDTNAFANDVPLLLSRPSDFTAEVIDGKIVSTHLRRLAVWAREGALHSLPGARLAGLLPLIEALAGAVIMVVALSLMNTVP